MQKEVAPGAVIVYPKRRRSQRWQEFQNKFSIMIKTIALNKENARMVQSVIPQHATAKQKLYVDNTKSLSSQNVCFYFIKIKF